MTARVLTLFPDMFPGPLGFSLAGRALQQGLWRLEAFDIRDHALDRHGGVDDTPFGGGPGMVMRPDVLSGAIQAVRQGDEPLLVLTPRGKPLTQARVRDLAVRPSLTLLCGRFEGFDQRVLDAHGAEEVSIGDYVLSGGELAAMALLDAVVRLLPGVMGRSESGETESFEMGLLEYPQYTRPAVWEGQAVPEVLQSGHHGRIAAWRHAQMEAITRTRRPDLWARYLEEHERLKEKDQGHDHSD